MKPSQIFLVYLIGCLVCSGIILWIVAALSQGLKKFFAEYFPEKAVAALFIRMTKIALILAGVGAAVGAVFQETAGKNWLTLTWSVAEQFEQSFSEILILLAVFIAVFLIFAAIVKRSGRKTNA